MGHGLSDLWQVLWYGAVCWILLLKIQIFFSPKKAQVLFRKPYCMQLGPLEKSSISWEAISVNLVSFHSFCSVFLHRRKPEIQLKPLVNKACGRRGRPEVALPLKISPRKWVMSPRKWDMIAKWSPRKWMEITIPCIWKWKAKVQASLVSSHRQITPTPLLVVCHTHLTPPTPLSPTLLFSRSSVSSSNITQTVSRGICFLWGSW